MIGKNNFWSQFPWRQSGKRRSRRRDHVSNRAPEVLETRALLSAFDALKTATFLNNAPAPFPGRLSIWDGEGSTDLWTDARNWLSDEVPERGDQLIFPKDAVQFTAVNDFADLTTFSLVIEGGDYSLSGNSILLDTSGIHTAGGKHSISINFDLGTDAGPDTIIVDAGSSLSLTSTIEGTSRLEISGGGNLDLDNTSVRIKSDLLVSEMAGVSISSGIFEAASISISVDGPMTIDRSEFISASNISFSASATSATPVSGLLGESATTVASIQIGDSLLKAAANISIAATASAASTADGDTAEDINRDFARIVSESSAVIAVRGASFLFAGGDISITTLLTDSTTATAIARPTSSDPAHDAALALANVTSSAVAELGGATQVTAGGAFVLSATSTTNVTSTAVGAIVRGGAKGASVARVELDGNTRAAVTGDVSILASSVDVNSSSTTDVNSSATSTAGGASGTDAATAAALSSNGASTSEGGISFAAAVAINRLEARSTSASIESSGEIRATGAVRVTSSSDTSSQATADGRSTQQTGFGTGVGVAINRGSADNTAAIGGGGSIAGSSVRVQSEGQSSDSFMASAQSGAGDSNVGFAGAFARNSIDNRHEALVLPGAALDFDNSTVAIAAQSTTVYSATAAPGGIGGDSTQLGLGASIAINNVANSTRTLFADGANASNADNVRLIASGSHTVTTTATIGGQGGLAILPGVATAVTNNVTVAGLGTGSGLNINGNLDVSATHTASTITTTRGDAASTGIAAGGAFSFSDATDQAAAFVDRNLNASGSVDVTARTTATGKAESVATATGNADNSGSTTNSTISSTAAAAGSAKSTDPATTPAGDLGAAAAIAVHHNNPSSTASIGNDVQLSAGGSLTLTALNSTDLSAHADASVVGSLLSDPAIGVGVAAAINQPVVETQAVIGSRARVSAAGVSVRALLPSTDTDGHNFRADAISGAGAEELAVVGSLARNKVQSTTEATIESLANVLVGNQDLTITAANNSVSVATAVPNKDSVTAKELGIGGTFALNKVENTTRGEIADNVTVTQVNNLTIDVSADHTVTTDAQSGAGSSEGNIALLVVVGSSSVENDTTARMGIGGQSLVGGDVSLSASHTGSVATTAAGAVKAEDLGLSLPIALNSVSENATATMGSAHVVGSVSVSTSSDTSDVVTAKAGARGGEITPLQNLNSQVGGTAAASGSPAGAPGTPALQTPDGVLNAAGAVGVNRSASNAQASIANGAVLQIAGSLRVLSVSESLNRANADASAVGKESSGGTGGAGLGIGVGVAVAVNRSQLQNEASIGESADVQAHGIELIARMNDDGGPTRFSTEHRAQTEAISGAGAGNVGVAGAIAINLPDSTTAAVIHNSANVRSGEIGSSITDTDDLLLSADSHAVSSAVATSQATSSEGFGVGGSFALNAAAHETSTEIANGVIVEQFNDITLATSADHVLATIVEAGTLGGAAVSPALAINVGRNVASAHVADGPAVSLSGNLVVSAQQDAEYSTEASAKAVADKAALGAAIGLNVADDVITAAISRDATVGGNVHVSAENDAHLFVESRASARGETVLDQIPGGLLEPLENRDGDSLLRRGQSYARNQLAGVRSVNDVKDSFNELKDALNSRSQLAGNKSMPQRKRAAAVSANVAQPQTTAFIDDGVVIAADGDVHVQSISDTDSEAKALGFTLTISDRNASQLALAIDLSRDANTAFVGENASVTGESIRIEAMQPEGEFHEIRAQALGGGFAQDSDFAGSVTLASAKHNTAAFTKAGADLNSTSTIDVFAAQETQIGSLAGAAAAGLGNSVGISIALTGSDHSTTAALGPHSTADADGAIAVAARNTLGPRDAASISQLATAVAGGITASSDPAELGVGLATAAALVTDTTAATIEDDAVVNAEASAPTQAVDVLAANDMAARVSAATGTGGLTDAFGVGLAIQILEPTVVAAIAEAADVHAAGDVRLTAIATDDVETIAGAVTVSISGGFALGSTVAYTDSSGHVEAGVGDGAHITTSGNLLIAANRSSNVLGNADGVSIGVGTGAFGVGVARVKEATSVDAYIGANAVVSAAGSNAAADGSRGVSVAARSSEQLTSVALGISAGENSGPASITSALVENRTSAWIGDDARVSASNSAADINPDITVDAVSSTDVVGLAGSTSVSIVGGVAVSAGWDVTNIGKATQAWIGAGVIADAEQDVQVNAESFEDITSIPVSMGILGDVNVMGSLGVVVLKPTTISVLGVNPADRSVRENTPAVIHAGGNVIVGALDQSDVDVLSGNAGGLGDVSVGASGAVPVVKKVTEARIANNAVVTADARTDRAAADVRDGGFAVSFVSSLPPGEDASREVRGPAIATNADTDLNDDGNSDLTDSSFGRFRTALPTERTWRGVAVSAVSADDIGTVAVSGGLAGSVAVNLVVPYAVMANETTASIGQGAQVNVDSSGAGSQQSVFVTAGSDLYELGIGGTGNLSGTAGVGTSGSVLVVNNETTALIESNAIVHARQNVQVLADASEDILMVAAGAALSGTVGAGSSLNYLKLQTQTHAGIAANADVVADGSVLVSSRDVSDVDLIAGAAGLALNVFGGGVSAGIVSVDKDTQAFIGAGANVHGRAFGGSLPGMFSGNLTATGFSHQSQAGVMVQAYSTEDVLNIGAAGGGSVTAAVAGGITGTIIDADTKATIAEGATVNADNNNDSTNQSVNVAAVSDTKVIAIAGGLAVGLGIGGLGGSVNLGTIRNDVVAKIDGDVNAKNDVLVNALSRKDVDAWAVSIGVGLVGLNASVSVWSVGEPFDSNYSDGPNTKDSVAVPGGGTVDGNANAQVLSLNNAVAVGLSEFPGANPSQSLPATPNAVQQVGVLTREAVDSVESNSPGSTGIVDLLRGFDTAIPPGVTALLGDDGHVVAGDALKIQARDAVDVKIRTGGASLGILSGGGSVSVLNLASHTSATLDGSAQANSIEVTSTLDSAGPANSAAVDVLTLAGSAGLVGLGAAVSVVRDKSTQDASVGENGSVTNSGSLSVLADRDAVVSAATGQAAAGIGAVGASWVQLTEAGSMRAFIADGAQVGQSPAANEIASVGTISVLADADIRATAEATGVTAGVASGTLNFTTTNVSPIIQASIGNGANVAANGNILVRAQDAIGLGIQANATTRGVGLGAFATIGASKAEAILLPSIRASIGTGTQVVSGGDVTVSAQLPANSHANATAKSSGISGGISGNGARSIAISSATVNAFVSSGVSIDAVGDVTVRATSNNNVNSIADGLAIGAAGVGGSLAEATVDGSTSARLASQVNLSAGSLTIESMVSDHVRSEAVAAAGGILSGTGAKAVTKLYPGSLGNANNFGMPSADIQAGIADGTFGGAGSDLRVDGDVTIQTLVTSEADAFAKGRSLSLVGVGGSVAEVNVSPVIQTYVGDRAAIMADGDVQISTTLTPGTVTDNPATSPFDQGEAPAGDGITTAAAKGSSGALLVGVALTTAEATLEPVVQTTIGGLVGISARNITVSANADGNAQALAPNKSTGFVSISDSNAIARIDRLILTEVAGNSQLTATESLIAEADSDLEVVAAADAGSTGVVKKPVANAVATLTGATQTTIRGDAALAARDVEITSVSQEAVDAVAEADGGNQDGGDDSGGPALRSNSEASATARIGESAQSPSIARVDVQSGADIQADTVSIVATNMRVDGNSEADAFDQGLSASPGAFATTQTFTHADVILNSGSAITGQTSVTLKAEQGGEGASRKIDTDADATAHRRGLGNAEAAAVNTQSSRALIEGRNDALITTRHLDVVTTTRFGQFDGRARIDRFTLSDIVLTPTMLRQSDRDIQWDADVVILSAPSPTLIIDAFGNVVEAVNIEIEDLDHQTLGPILADRIDVRPISSSPTTNAVLFQDQLLGFDSSTVPFGLKGAIAGFSGTVTFVRTLDAVTISNASMKDLRLTDIDVVSSEIPITSSVTIDVERDSQFGFNVNHDFRPTTISVENTRVPGAPDILLSGRINNPIGDTSLHSRAGDILESLRTQIITNTLTLSAPAGQIGTGTTTFAVHPIDLQNAPATVSATAGQDLHLRLQPHIRRDLLPGETYSMALDSVNVGGAIDLDLGQAVVENSVPNNTLTILVHETFPKPDGRDTVVRSHFRPLSEEFPLPLPVGVFGFGTELVPTTYNFDGAQAGGDIDVIGPDSLLVSVAGSLTTTGDGDISLTNLRGADVNLAGGKGSNLFRLTNWRGSAFIDGGLGADELELNLFAGSVTTADVLALIGDVDTVADDATSFLNGQLELPRDVRFRIADGTPASDLSVNAIVSGPGGLIKQGDGTLLLRRDNTYAGKTLLEAGTVWAHGSQPQSPVVLDGGSLGGDGTVGAISNLKNRDSAVFPGTAGAPGTLTVDGGLDVSRRQVTFYFDLAGSAASERDLIRVLGSVNLKNAVLQLPASLTFPSVVGSQYMLIDNDGNDPVQNTFRKMPEGGDVQIGGIRMQITYRGGDGNDVVLTHVNSDPRILQLQSSQRNTEGRPVTLLVTVSDPDPLDVLNLVVNWADGSEETLTFPAGTRTMTLTHVYQDDGNYRATVRLVDSHGAATDGRITIHVDNDAPSVSVTAPAGGVRGQSLDFAFSATDASPIDQAAGFRYRINWGDDSPRETFDGVRAVNLSHVYEQEGTFTVEVEVRDKDRARTTVYRRVTIIAATEARRIADLFRSALRQVPDPLHTFLNPDRTVNDDSATDLLFGSVGEDEFFASLFDATPDPFHRDSELRYQ